MKLKVGCSFWIFSRFSVENIIQADEGCLIFLGSERVLCSAELVLLIVTSAEELSVSGGVGLDTTSSVPSSKLIATISLIFFQSQSDQRVPHEPEDNSD